MSTAVQRPSALIPTAVSGALTLLSIAWFAANARRLSLESSLQQVAGAYARWDSARS